MQGTSKFFLFSAFRFLFVAVEVSITKQFKTDCFVTIILKKLEPVAHDLFETVPSLVVLLNLRYVSRVTIYLMNVLKALTKK